MYEDSSYYENDSDEAYNMLIERFKRMMDSGRKSFFDADELDQIIDHFIFTDCISLAKRAINYGLELYPNKASLQVRNAMLLSQFDEADSALSILSEVEKNSPYEPEVLMAKGLVYSQMMRHTDAISYFQKALPYTDDTEGVLLNISFEYQNIKQFKQAIHVLKKCLQINPESDAAINELYFCYEASEDIKSAITFFNSFIDENPYSETAWYNLGCLYRTDQDIDKAANALDYAIAINPDFFSAYYTKAYTLFCADRFLEALKVYEEIKEIDRPNTLLYQMLGECQYELANYEEALKYFQIAVNINEGIVDSLCGIALCLDALDRPKEAINYLKKAIEASPENIETFDVLINIAINSGQKRIIEPIYKKALILSDNDPDVLHSYIDFLRNYCSVEKALHATFNAITLIPADVSFRYRIVCFLVESKQLVEAISQLLIAMAIDCDATYFFNIFNPSILENKAIANTIEKFKS